MSAGEDEEEGVFRDFYDRITRARGVGIGEIERSIMELCVERQDASTLLRYLQHIEGGYRSNEESAGGVVIGRSHWLGSSITRSRIADIRSPNADYCSVISDFSSDIKTLSPVHQSDALEEIASIETWGVGSWLMCWPVC